MRIVIFIIFSIIISYLTKEIWLELNPWGYKVLFLSVIILIPYFLYSIAAELSFNSGWFGGLIIMIIVLIIDNYLTNAFSNLIISKSENNIFDFSGFNLNIKLLFLPWYSYLLNGLIGIVTGFMGEKQRELEEEEEEDQFERFFKSVASLAFFYYVGVASPEYRPILRELSPMFTATALSSELVSKTGSLAISESTKITNNNFSKNTKSTLGVLVEEQKASNVKIPHFDNHSKELNSYRRDIFEKGFSKIKRELSTETGNNHIDTYTRKPLKPGEAWDCDHIVSAKESSTLDGLANLSPEIQSSILNNRKNIGFTMRNINKSKGKYSLEEWLNRKSNGRTITNAEFYNIDKERAISLRNEVLSFLKKEIAKNQPQ